MNTAFEVTQPYEFRRNSDWPIDIGISTGCILGYIFAWIGLVTYFHPNHWVAGVSGALAGWFVGWVWYRLVDKNKAILKG